MQKVPASIEYIKDVLESQNKVVIFAHHHDVIDKIYEEFKNEAVKLTGSDSIEERQKAVDDFQNNEKIKIFIGSIKAAGIGITLTSASLAIFLELDWVPANMIQAEDRLHRIGQKDSVNIHYLVINGSIDSRLSKTLLEKEKMINTALNIEFNKTEVINSENKEQQDNNIFFKREEFINFSESEKELLLVAIKQIADKKDGIGFNKSEEN